LKGDLLLLPSATRATNAVHTNKSPKIGRNWQARCYASARILSLALYRLWGICRKEEPTEGNTVFRPSEGIADNAMPVSEIECAIISKKLVIYFSLIVNFVKDSICC
jgi:hypothetical protein